MSTTTNNIISAAKAAFAAAAAARPAIAENHVQYWAWYDRLEAAQKEARSCEEWVYSYQDEGAEVPAHVLKAARAAEAELARVWAEQPVKGVEASIAAQNRLYEAIQCAREAGSLLAQEAAKNVDTRRQAVVEGLAVVRNYAYESVIEPKHGHMAFF